MGIAFWVGEFGRNLFLQRLVNVMLHPFGRRVNVVGREIEFGRQEGFPKPMASDQFQRGVTTAGGQRPTMFGSFNLSETP